MFINIYISSKNKNSLIRFLKFLQTLSENKYIIIKIIQIKFNNLKHRKIFTILKLYEFEKIDVESNEV